MGYRNRRSLLTIAPALLAVACSPGERAADTAAADVVRNNVGEGRPLRVTEELRIGGFGDEASFYLVRGAAVDAARNIHVLDAGNHRVAVFDPGGVPLRTFGREGRGPGDLQQPGSIWITHDTIAISDTGNRLHLFLSDGTHIQTRAFLDLMTGTDQWRTAGAVGTPAGWLVPASAYFRTDEHGSDSVLPPLLRMRVFRLGADDLEPTGAYWEDESEGRWDGIFFVRAPYAYSARVAVDGLGRTHVAMTGDYHVDVYDIDGRRVLRIVNEVPRVPIEGEMLERWKASRACAPAQPECDDQRTRLALSLPMDEHVPVVEEVRGFVNGHTAVRRSATDPDPEDHIAIGDYDFFDPDGRYIGTLAAGPSPRWFDGETLIAVEWDQLQVASVVRYRVEPQGQGP